MLEGEDEGAEQSILPLPFMLQAGYGVDEVVVE